MTAPPHSLPSSVLTTAKTIAGPLTTAKPIAKVSCVPTVYRIPSDAQIPDRKRLKPHHPTLLSLPRKIS